VLRPRDRRSAVDQYLRGYQEQPETDEEQLLGIESARAVFAQEAWE